ncbi:hypothetical protein SAMN05216436_10416 [bacterium A37T11]|nr:hypothetical protein SAMN05216436_10416 [bacterium A37T11]
MFERPYLQNIINRIKEPRNFIQVIMGPRQVGKSTLITQLTEKLYIPFQFIWLSQPWDTARLLMQQQGASEYLLVIDEIQKISNWSETVKLLWEKVIKPQIRLCTGKARECSGP